MDNLTSKFAFFVKVAIYLYVETKHFSFHTLDTAEAVVCSCFQNSQRNTYDKILQLYLKKTLSEMYSMKFFEFFKACFN